jgi:uncharacterized alpha-E superfamily protein
MLSRVADSLYWMSRYIERAENVARFVDVNLNLMLDSPVGLMEQWGPLILITAAGQPFLERYAEPTQENVIQFLTFDSENPDSIRSCLLKARENARSIREVIPFDLWTEINDFHLKVSAPAALEQAAESPHDFFSYVRRSAHLVEGVTHATLSRGEAWHFSRIGRLIERADQTTRLLDTKYFLLLPSVTDVGTPVDDLYWSAVLKSASAFTMYRQRHGRLSPDRVCDFLILDREFPRSVQFCVTNAEESARAISGTPPGTYRNEAERHLGRLSSELTYTDVSAVLQQGLHEFLDGLQIRLNEIGDGIYTTFIESRPVAQDLTQRNRGFSA